MNLYIQIVDGNIINHPILESNLKQIFPNIDLNDSNCGYIPFERIPEPTLGVYEVNEGSTYNIVDGVAKDVWNIRAMTEEEKTSKQEEVKTSWNESGFSSWIFNDETCSFEPPTPYPDGDGNYEWNEETTTWDSVDS